jgi:hypothetical protein
MSFFMDASLFLGLERPVSPLAPCPEMATNFEAGQIDASSSATLAE